MNQALVDKIVNAVLYEGYILYPYRPSVKNRQRWTFGGIYPRSYCEARDSGDPWSMQTECLVRPSAHCTLHVKVRFLHLTQRFVRQLDRPRHELETGEEPQCRLVDSLQVGDRRYQTWQEAVEREIVPNVGELAELPTKSERLDFTFPGSRQREPIRDEGEAIVAFVDRDRQSIRGTIELSAQQMAEDLYKMRVRIENSSSLEDVSRTSRDEAQLRTLVSTHTILEARGGEFASLIDPPGELRQMAAECRNIGAWPVLVGAPGERDAMLSSPIILYDYPEIARESPGDLFDGTEIDEILSLRILTLTDDEKQAAAAVDERVRALLHRTETLGQEQFLDLHGAMRGLRPIESGARP
jgi:hydrogenase maturation protease